MGWTLCASPGVWSMHWVPDPILTLVVATHQSQNTPDGSVKHRFQQVRSAVIAPDEHSRPIKPLRSGPLPVQAGGLAPRRGVVDLETPC